jgi:hypothetical protein
MAPLPPRKVLESIEFDVKQEAYRIAQANRNRAWARRYLRARERERMY